MKFNLWLLEHVCLHAINKCFVPEGYSLPHSVTLESSASIPLSVLLRSVICYVDNGCGSALSLSLFYACKSKSVHPRLNWRVSVNFSAQVFINFPATKLFLNFRLLGVSLHILLITPTTPLQPTQRVIFDKEIFHLCGIV